jgi:hypothetical protein
MIHNYLENYYLAYNFIVGSIYLLWIFLLYYNKCECSKHILEKMIHVYWYVIFILDILLFFKYLSTDNLHLIIFGNLLGLVNIYMTYRYMKFLKDTNCECSNMLLKDLIIIIYICSVFFIFAFFIVVAIYYMTLTNKN